jgi:hypothetical protein
MKPPAFCIVTPVSVHVQTLTQSFAKASKHTAESVEYLDTSAFLEVVRLMIERAKADTVVLAYNDAGIA